MESIGLVWIYCGSDVGRRMSTIDGMIAGEKVNVRLVSGAVVEDPPGPLRGPGRIVQAANSDLDTVLRTFPSGTGVVIFWRDDDKDVAPDFPEHLAAPLVEGHRDIHYWDRNALAVRWDRQDSLLGDLNEPVDLAGCSLLEIMSALIGHRAANSGRRIGIALASESRFLGVDVEGDLESLGLAS